MDQDVANRRIVRQDKSVTLCDVKPFDRARNLDQAFAFTDCFQAAPSRLFGPPKRIDPPSERTLSKVNATDSA
jgi:hypothetical protein